MTDLQTLMACVTLLGAAALFWDSRKRELASAKVVLGNDAESRLSKRVDDLSAQVEKLDRRTVEEFEAMKSEFDRLKARDAIEAYNQPRGHNARPY
jgi:hypothetical protein